MINLPSDFLKRTKNTLGAEFSDFLNAYNYPPYRGFRVNVSKISPEEFFALRGQTFERVPWCENGFYFKDGDGISGRDPHFRAGLYYIQEPSAMSAAGLLDVQKGDRVLDLCAAPGGKSTQIAERLGGDGLLVSNEYAPKRAAVLRENIERLGFKNVIVTNAEVSALAEKQRGEFDKILVDAPCSGEGMFRKEPAAVAAWSLEHSRSCAARQLKILESAAGMLRAGGRLVYSTCTFAECENEDVISEFLKTHGEFELLKTVKIYPHRQKGEGHFAAALQKRGEQAVNNPTASKKKGRANERETQPPAEFSEFADKNLIGFNKPRGEYVLFGGRLFLTPPDAPRTDGIKVLSAGLYLGDVKKNRFEPSHALCLALRAEDFRKSVNLSHDSVELQKFLRGETLEAACGNGWCAVLADGFPIGWGKASDGVLKNKYPKGLRIQG